MINKELDAYIRKAHIERPINHEMNRRMFGQTTVMANMVNIPGESFKVALHGRRLAVPEHKHDFFELMYVYDGSITQIIGEERITLDRGAICLMDTKIAHGTDECGEQSIGVNFIMNEEIFGHTFFKSLSENSLFSEFFTNALYRPESFGRYIVIHTGDDKKVRQIATDIMTEYFFPDICSTAAIEGLLPLFFNQLFRVWKDRGGKKILHAPDGVSNVWPILRYIEANYITATLKETAGRFGYSSSYLSTLLAKTTGRSFTEIKHEICMNQAALLLAGSDMIISDVAQSVGFSNMSFFYSLFNRRYGMTPADYREKTKH